jgi:hypothetical protein
MPPRGDVMAGRIEEGAEPELAFWSWHDAFPQARIYCRAAIGRKPRQADLEAS